MRATEVPGVNGVYVSKKGNDTFKYTVTGTPEELAALKAAKGVFYRENENGTPLLFFPEYAGPACDLIITRNNNVIPDRTLQKKLNSMVKQAGGNLGAAAAADASRILFASQMPRSTQAKPIADPVKPEEEPADGTENLGEG